MSASEQPQDLAEMIRMRAKSRGEAIAYEFEGRQTSFAEFDRKTNVVMAPVNWRLAGPEVAFIVEDCKAPVLFVGPEFITQVRNIRDRLPSVRTVITTEGGAPEWQDFAAWRDARSADDPKVPISPRDIAI